MYSISGGGGGGGDGASREGRYNAKRSFGLVAAQARAVHRHNATAAARSTQTQNR